MKRLKEYSKRLLKGIFHTLGEWLSAVLEALREYAGLMLLVLGVVFIVYGVFLVWGAGISFLVFGSILAILGVLYNIDDRQ